MVHVARRDLGSPAESITRSRNAWRRWVGASGSSILSQTIDLTPHDILHCPTIEMTGYTMRKVAL